MKKRVFSGIRATGRLHLGNYLGAVKGMLALQDQYDCIFGVMVLHAITTPYNPQKLPDDTRQVILDYLAAGLDPQKCHLMIQSFEHVDLSYLLSTIYPVSRLEDLPTYKDKKAQYPKDINLALLYYPVLMAADILLYKAELVPVGIDQEPHLEVTREIARKFNLMFGQTFPEPQRFATSGGYIPSLTGTGKMSKSVEGSFINLTDDLETIKAKLAKAPTDSGRGSEIPKVGGVAALLEFIRLFEGDKIYNNYKNLYLTEGLKYKGLKEELANAIFKELKPIQEKRKYYEEHSEIVDQILEEGRKYCSGIAEQTLKEVKEKMGLV